MERSRVCANCVLSLTAIGGADPLVRGLKMLQNNVTP